MSGQTDILQDSEGDAWWYRNKDRLPPANDPVLHIIERAELKPADILEIGCANGWRLAELKKHHQCTTTGVDTSLAALKDGERYGLALWYGEASRLNHFRDNQFDLVILGFCLYLVDREDLFRIVKETDRVLKNGGHLIIYDFCSSITETIPYKHDSRLRCYKMPYHKLWMANPTYTCNTVMYADDPETAAWLLKKDLGIWRDKQCE